MTETYNISGVPVDYQDRMAQKMTGEVHEKEQASFVRRDRVLEIIDSYKYGLCWSISEKLWDENLDKIKEKVLKLKEGGLE